MLQVWPAPPYPVRPAIRPTIIGSNEGLASEMPTASEIRQASQRCSNVADVASGNAVLVRPPRLYRRGVLLQSPSIDRAGLAMRGLNIDLSKRQVPERGCERLVAHQFLKGKDVTTITQERNSERVPEAMRVHI